MLQSRDIHQVQIPTIYRDAINPFNSFDKLRLSTCTPVDRTLIILPIQISYSFIENSKKKRRTDTLDVRSPFLLTCSWINYTELFGSLYTTTSALQPTIWFEKHVAWLQVLPQRTKIIAFYILAPHYGRCTNHQNTLQPKTTQDTKKYRYRWTKMI